MIACVFCPPGDHKYVPPVTLGVAVSVVLLPLQITVLLTDKVNVFTVIVVVALAVQLLPISYVTVYVVVVLGEAFTTEPVVLSNPVLGLHV